jgi:uncharacterized protein (TIGR00255 family)
MIQSMTGFGEARTESGGIDYTVEIKSVNNRYLKTMVRVPDSVAFMEQEIENLLRENLTRGTINYVLRLKNVAANALFEIDEEVLRSLVGRLREIGSSLGSVGTIDIASLLTLPGLVHPALPSEEEAARARELVVRLTGQALDRLKQMRRSEGEYLQADLKGHCQAMAAELGQIRQRSDSMVHEYATRLRRRVDTLLAEAKLKLDEETLAREVAILADRSDISEELARLDAHLQQFCQICETDGHAGRRLDFLSQEMLREANTVASKAADAEIARRIVDVKCLIERLKEQIQNVE